MVSRLQPTSRRRRCGRTATVSGEACKHPATREREIGTEAASETAEASRERKGESFLETLESGIHETDPCDAVRANATFALETRERAAAPAAAAAARWTQEAERESATPVTYRSILVCLRPSSPPAPGQEREEPTLPAGRAGAALETHHATPERAATGVEAAEIPAEARETRGRRTSPLDLLHRRHHRHRRPEGRNPASRRTSSHKSSPPTSATRAAGSQATTERVCVGSVSPTGMHTRVSCRCATTASTVGRPTCMPKSQASCRKF